MKTKMTAEKKRAWLAAIGKLERFYRAVTKEEKPFAFDCPLCSIPLTCSGCLWEIFEDNTCGHALSKRREHNIPWAKDSLERLARWRKKLEKA